MPSTGSVREEVVVAMAAAAQAGLEGRDATVMRVGTSVLVRLPHAGAVARVEPIQHAASVQRQVAFARAAARVDAPVVRLQVPEAIEVFLDGTSWLVTMWALLEPVAPVGAQALGQAARALHHRSMGVYPAQEQVSASGGPTPGAEPPVPPADPLAAARALLARPHRFLTPADQAGLQDLVEQLTQRWEVELALAPRALVHGDLHPGNVVVTAAGPVLVDLEYAGVGPVGLDLAAVGAHVKRYGLDPQWIQGFAQGYGEALHEAPGHDLLCDVYALHVALWALQVAHTHPEVAREAALRVECLLGRSTATWTLR